MDIIIDILNLLYPFRSLFKIFIWGIIFILFKHYVLSEFNDKDEK